MTDANLVLSLDAFTAARNSEKALFTAGPASLLTENLSGLCPCFGRGDPLYDALEQRVMGRLSSLTGHSKIARLQGSASLALEIATLNFLAGKVLIVSSGYYSDRLHSLVNTAKSSTGHIREVQSASWTDLENVSGQFDWIVACYTETSRGIRVPIHELRRLANKVGARLMVDATASIGLEDQHDLADVLAYSSCKGLFGLTGAAFLAFSGEPENEVASLYLCIQTHLEKRVTGPYHAIASLDRVLENHAHFRESVVINKARFLRQMRGQLTQPEKFQPLLCTHVDAVLRSAAATAVTYSPRGNLSGSVVCHLGEAHLGALAEGKILELLDWEL